MDPQPSPPSDAYRTLILDPARGPIRVIVEPPRGSWFGTIFKWVISIIILLWIVGAVQRYGNTDSDLQEHWHSLSKDAHDKIAIISVEGTIMGDESFVKKQLDHVRNDDHFKAIVLRVDSPGGTVTGSDYIYHHVKKLVEETELPLVVSMGSVAASGGYYVAMATGEHEDTIFAEPTTWTGSIGVIIPHYDVSGLLEKLNIADDSIASNPLKMMGSPTRKFPEPIRAEEQKILQELVNSSFDSFKEIVLASRVKLREDQAAQATVFTGRIFTAKQALQYHLIDKLGFVEDAIDRAVEMSGLDKHDVRVVHFQKPATLLELVMLGGQSRKPPIDVSTLLELTAPKAYYLCTGLPGLISARQ